jgi:peptidoglycan/xylan/chitin deacetylase (PgdA/CDA1 family)
MRVGILILILLGLAGSGFAQPRIIIKLDDLGSKNHTNAAPVLDILVQRKIKAALGVIALGLDSTAGKAYGKYLAATNVKGEKLFEIWNHGLDHTNNIGPDSSYEFKGTNYQFQKEHLGRSQARVKQLLGVTMHTFGAPFNASDKTTYKVLDEQGDYKIFLFGDVDVATRHHIKNYNNRVEMEITTGQVNYAHFVADYQKYKSKYTDLMVLQGHPNMWDAAKLLEFNKILDYLIAQKCEFVLPYEYYLRRK